MTKRTRRVGSIKSELLKKSREAVLAAVQIFNNPNITFKAESYVVLMTIGWTYFFHAYYTVRKKSNTATSNSMESANCSTRPGTVPTNIGNLSVV